MTRITRTTKKPNIGYEERVFIAKNCRYFHANKDCPLVVENSSMVYKQVRITKVPKGIECCPNCGQLE